MYVYQRPVVEGVNLFGTAALEASAGFHAVPVGIWKAHEGMLIPVVERVLGSPEGL